MSINITELRRLSELTLIALSESEEQALASDLEQILQFVSAIRAVPTEGIEPMAHALDLIQPLREDSVSECSQQEKLMAGAPAHENGHFLVPRIVE